MNDLPWSYVRAILVTKNKISVKYRPSEVLSGVIGGGGPKHRDTVEMGSHLPGTLIGCFTLFLVPYSEGTNPRYFNSENRTIIWGKENDRKYFVLRYIPFGYAVPWVPWSLVDRSLTQLNSVVSVSAESSPTKWSVQKHTLKPWST